MKKNIYFSKIYQISYVNFLNGITTAYFLMSNWMNQKLSSFTFFSIHRFLFVLETKYDNNSIDAAEQRTLCLVNLVTVNSPGYTTQWYNSYFADSLKNSISAAVDIFEPPTKSAKWYFVIFWHFMYCYGQFRHVLFHFHPYKSVTETVLEGINFR